MPHDVLTDTWHPDIQYSILVLYQVLLKDRHSQENIGFPGSPSSIAKSTFKTPS
jgi:hypothetical protein